MFQEPFFWIKTYKKMEICWWDYSCKPSCIPCTTNTIVSMESRYQHLLSSLDWSLSLLPASFPVSMSLSLDIQVISQSRWVPYSTSKKFSSLNESQSRHPRNFSVSMCLSLNIQEISQSWSWHPTYPSLSLDEFQSLHPQNIKVLLSLSAKKTQTKGVKPN